MDKNRQIKNRQESGGKKKKEIKIDRLKKIIIDTKNSHPRPPKNKTYNIRHEQVRPRRAAPGIMRASAPTIDT